MMCSHQAQCTLPKHNDSQTLGLNLILNPARRPAAAASTQGLDRDMFMLVWGPTVAAVSVVLDHADNPVIVSTALEGLMHAARIAAYHHIDEVRRVVALTPEQRLLIETHATNRLFAK